MIKAKFILLFLIFSIFQSRACDHEQEPPKYARLSLLVPPYAEVIDTLQTKGTSCAYPNRSLFTAQIESKDAKETVHWTAGCNHYNLGLLRDDATVLPKAMYVSVLREAGLDNKHKIHIQVHLEFYAKNRDKFWFWEKDFIPLEVYLHTICVTQPTLNTLSFTGDVQGASHTLQNGTHPQYFSTSSGILSSPFGEHDKIAAQYLLDTKKLVDGLPNGTLILQ